MNENGRNICIAVAVYTAIKQILNLIIGGFFWGGLLIAVGIPLIMGLLLLSGIKYMNYAVSAMIAVVVIRHIGYNITHLPSTAIYLIEAVADVFCIIQLTLNRNVRENFRKGIGGK